MVELKKLETPLQQLPPIDQTPSRILTIVPHRFFFFFFQKQKKIISPSNLKMGKAQKMKHSIVPRVICAHNGICIYCAY